MIQDVQSKVSDVVLGKEKPVEETNPEYEKLRRYIFELEDHLAEAQKHAYRLVKRHRGICDNKMFECLTNSKKNNRFNDRIHILSCYNTICLIIAIELGQSLADFGKAIKLLGACEGDALGAAFSELGAKSEMLSIKLQREVSYIYKNSF